MRKLIPFLVVLGVLTLGLIFAVTPGGASTSAAPAPAPTPAADINVATNSSFVTFFLSRVVTEDVASPWIDASRFEFADVQYVIDQSGTNTTTLKLQFSNDGVNVVDGATLVSANVADASGLNQQALFGRYARVYADVSNATATTITANAVVKR
jgi:hypothetical protein